MKVRCSAAVVQWRQLFSCAVSSSFQIFWTLFSNVSSFQFLYRQSFKLMWNGEYISADQTHVSVRPNSRKLDVKSTCLKHIFRIRIVQSRYDMNKNFLRQFQISPPLARYKIMRDSAHDFSFEFWKLKFELFYHHKNCFFSINVLNQHCWSSTDSQRIYEVYKMRRGPIHSNSKMKISVMWPGATCNHRSNRLTLKSNRMRLVFSSFFRNHLFSINFQNRTILIRMSFYILSL